MNTQALDLQINQSLKQASKSNTPIVLITGGPTCEDIDPVRFISNRSTGKMGIESAVAAKEMGLSPLLILGPTHLNIPDNSIPVVNIRTAQMLYYTLDKLFDYADFLIMSAAVADFTPIRESTTKLKKSEIEDTNKEFTLRLKRTVDILKALKDKPNRTQKYIAGFSLDTDINISEGRRKLQEKSLDLIVINSTAAFAANHSNIVLITRDNNNIELKDNDKRNTAKIILTELLRLKNIANNKGNI